MGNYKAKVIVVDDDPFVRDLIVYILTDDGYEVVAAEHGAHALSLMDEIEGFDIAITDLNMPVLDGIGFIKSIRDKEYKIPVILLSGASDNSIEKLKDENVFLIIKNDSVHEVVLLTLEKLLSSR